MALELGTLVPVCLVLIGGATSPGPSLAVVLRNTLIGGRSRGIACSVGHGIGFGIYAFTAILGISFLKGEGSFWASGLELTGALFLVFVGIQMLRLPKSDDADAEDGHAKHSESATGFVEGFLIAFLNPKIFVFLTAIFSQFVPAGMPVADGLLLASIALVIDTGWYVLVVLALSGTKALDALRERGWMIDFAVGLILIGLAAMMLLRFV